MSSRGYSSRSGSGGDNADEQGQLVGREMLFSWAGVKPPRLDQDQVLTTAMVAKYWLNFTVIGAGFAEKVVMDLNADLLYCRKWWT